MTPPLFSVILIAYNQHATIVAAARSALSALGATDELLCVDDGSYDDTPRLLDELAAVDTRLRVLHLPHSGRPAVARNAGLAAARGAWVSFLDGDDLYAQTRFTVMRGLVTGPHFDGDLIFHNHLVFMDGEPPSSGLPRITPDVERDMADTAGAQPCDMAQDAVWRLDGDRLAVFLLARRFVLQTSSFCVRKTLLDARGLTFDERRVFGEDNLFMLACAMGSRVTYIRESLTYYRKHWGSLTARIDPAGHREQLQSLHEQVSLVEVHAAPAVTAVSRDGMRRMLYEATLHQGYLLERSGRSAQAARLYLSAAASFRSVWAAVLAAKALVRKPAPVPQVLEMREHRAP